MGLNAGSSPDHPHGWEKMLNLSEPQFLICEMGMIAMPTSDS